MAKAVRKTRSPRGAQRPMSASTPRANAMSVAIGTPQPRVAGESRPTTRTKTTAGTSAPPNAATTGRVARRTESSSPTSTSRLISRPMTRKNTAIRASLIHHCRSRLRSNPATRNSSSVCHRSSYEAAHGEFTQTSATTVARISSTPPDALLSVNARNGARIRSIGGGWRVIAP